MRVLDQGEEVGSRQAEGGEVKRKTADRKLENVRRIDPPNVVFHAKRTARVFQSVVGVLPRSYTFAVKCNLMMMKTLTSMKLKDDQHSVMLGT